MKQYAYAYDLGTPSPVDDSGNVITVDGTTKISRYRFGHFDQNVGRCVRGVPADYSFTKYQSMASEVSYLNGILPQSTHLAIKNDAEAPTKFPTIFLRRMRFVNEFLNASMQGAYADDSSPHLHSGLLKIYRGAVPAPTGFDLMYDKGVCVDFGSLVNGALYNKLQSDEWCDVNEFLPLNYEYNKSVASDPDYVNSLDWMLLASRTFDIVLDSSILNSTDNLQKASMSQIEVEINSNYYLV